MSNNAVIKAVAVFNGDSSTAHCLIRLLFIFTQTRLVDLKDIHCVWFLVRRNSKKYFLKRYVSVIDLKKGVCTSVTAVALHLLFI